MSECATPNLAGYRNCELCPRRCRVDRTAGERGVCGEGAACRIAHAGPHFGEEPSFSGTCGSGTIFLSGCSCRCFFCQNHQISFRHEGDEYDPAALRKLALDLVERGVHNINFVTPDHFWPHIQWLCRALRADGVRIPFLYNCSGYQLPELIPGIAQAVEIFLPDFKYALPELAQECMGAPDYPEVALGALHAMVRARGFLEPWDPSGARTATHGVLVRHLVLPGQVRNSLQALELLHREFGPGLPLSVMSQYSPVPACRGRGDFARRVTAAEYADVCETVERLGFDQAYVQEPDTDAQFVPDFDRDEPFAGNPPAAREP